MEAKNLYFTKDLLEFFIRIPIILIVGLIFYYAGRRIIHRIYKLKVNAVDNKTHTVALMLQNIWKYMIFFVSILIIVSSLKSIAIPAVVLTAVIGSSLGFGAQSFLKDTVAGFSIIFEGQYTVGDKVSFEGLNVSGTVKKIGLRSTVVEDEKRNIWFVPNGEIKAVKKIIEFDS